MQLDFLIRIFNFLLIFDLIFGYAYLYSIDLQNLGIESTLFWIITTLPILLYLSSIFISFLLSNTAHKFHSVIDVLYPPLISLVSFLFGDFDYYIHKMKINEISKDNSIYITWLINTICEFFIGIPKAYLFLICERNLQEKEEVYKANKFLIQISKYLAIIGAIKGVVAILLAFYSFITFMLNDNINLGEVKSDLKAQKTIGKKKNE